MNFDLSDLHVVHVLIAYAVAGLGVLGLTLFTARDVLRTRRK
jgi:hypothetical protein